MRSRLVRFVALTGLLMLGLPVIAQANHQPTDKKITIGPSAGQVRAGWDEMYYPAQGNVGGGDDCPHEIDPGNALCDHIFMTVDVAKSYWQTHEGGAEVTITWPSADNDFDLYVYDKEGNPVAQSAAGGTTSERVVVEGANKEDGPYEIRVVPWLVIDSSYTGTAGFLTSDITTNPRRSTGGLTFGSATVVDPQRTEGEPLNWIDKDGNYWETGPYGTSTQQSFIHRSTDGGNQFNIVSPIGLRPNLPPGGGDTDLVTDDQRVAYFTDLEALVNLDGSVSNDDGHTWKKNPIAAAAAGTTIVDRQWFAVDNGTNHETGTPQNPDPEGAADNTVFLAYRQIPFGSFIVSTPGSKGPEDPVGGVVYKNSSDEGEVGTAAGAISHGAPCGQLRFDPVKRNLYYPCADSETDDQGNEHSFVEIAVGHVNVGQRTGIDYKIVRTPDSPGGGPVGDIFPAVATDKAGNLYAVWIDESDHNVYYSYSKDAGKTWGPVRQVNGNDANSNVFPWAQAGSAGKLVVAWYGNSSRLDSDIMPSWYDDRKEATNYPWYGYTSLISGAAGSSPSFIQQKFTRKPMHFGQICNGGLGCSLSDGDRTMADFMAVFLDRDGSFRFVYNDTTSQHHGAHIFETRQLTGPTAFGTSVSKTQPAPPIADPTDDAHYPHYFPGASTKPGGKAGPNLPPLDFTQLGFGQPQGAGSIQVRMRMSAPVANCVPPEGETTCLWLTRFQALSIGDGGEPAYRIFYVGAESATGGGPPTTFFAGSGESAQGSVAGNGCDITTAENCKIVQYPAEHNANGQVEAANPNIIRIRVPLQNGFGDDRPISPGTTAFNITGFTFGRNAPTGGAGGNSVSDIGELYADVDATRPFDYRLARTDAEAKDPVVVVTKTGPFTAKAGETIGYGIKYSNLGPNASQDAKITDALPKELKFVSASNGGTYDPTTRKITWKLGTVPVGVTGVVRFRALILPTVAAGTPIVNKAVYSALYTTATPTGVFMTTVVP